MLAEAMAEYRRAIELDAKLVEPRANLALALWQLGRTAEAREELRRALRCAKPGSREQLQIQQLLEQVGGP